MSPVKLLPYRTFRYQTTVDDERVRPGFETDAGGTLAMVDSTASIRQAILLLMATRPGERVMRPLYGCHLHRLAFLPNNETTAGLAVHYVRRALETWEPRIEVTAADAGPAPDAAERLEITIEYQVRSTGANDTLVYSVDLEGGAA